MPMAALPQPALADAAPVALPAGKTASGGFGDVLNHVLGNVSGTSGKIATVADLAVHGVDLGTLQGAVPPTVIPGTATPAKPRFLPEWITSTPPVAVTNSPVWDPTLGSKPAVPAPKEAAEIPTEEEAVMELVRLKAAPATVELPTVHESTAAEPSEPAAEPVPEHAEKVSALPFVPVDIFVPAPPPTLRLRVESAPESVAVAAKAVADVKPQAELAIAPDAAVKLTIRVPDEAPADPVPPPALRQAGPEKPTELLPEPRTSALEAEPVGRVPAVTRPAVPHAIEAVEPERKVASKKAGASLVQSTVETSAARHNTELSPAPAAPPVRTSEPLASARPREVAQPLPVMKEEIAPDPSSRAPLKSMSLEFSPDGSGEVHLKLAERAGELHISVHSNDAGLNHQLRSGIGDLATALAGAGYDADAWTSANRENRQHREQYQPEQQARNAGPAFSTLIDQPTEEVL